MIFDFATMAPPALTSILGGLSGYIVANRIARSNEKIAKINHEPVHEEPDTTGSLTKRFQVLLDGYEGHIQSLTAEVQGLRSEVRDLQQLMLERCVKCPYRLATGEAHG